MMISTALLRHKGACSDQIDLIHSLMGDEPFEVTRELCLAQYDKISWDWAAAHLLPAPAQEQYDKACTAAWEQYEKARVAAWEQYEKAYAVAQEQYVKAVAAAREQHDKVRAAAWKQHDRVRAAAWKQYDKARAVAFADACLTASAYLSR
jgi:hypothetical protein